MAEDPGGRQSPWKTSAATIVGGLVFFVAAVFFSIGLAQLNADWSPALPWFPIPVLGVLFGAVYWINRRWDIGLAIPPGTRWSLIVTFAIASMIASHAVLILEGAWHGLTRSFEPAPPGVSPFFAAVYWIGITIALSTASEVGFRGIMQSRLQPLFGVWPAILIVSLVNTLSHRWDGLYERTIGVFAILIAWGYLRHLSRSLTPTILTHIAAIFAWDLILWYLGPWDQGSMGAGTLAAVAVVGLVSFGASVWSARAITAQRH